MEQGEGGVILRMKGQGKTLTTGERRESFGCVVPRGGIEPPTRGFSGLCSTD